MSNLWHYISICPDGLCKTMKSLARTVCVPVEIESRTSRIHMNCLFKVARQAPSPEEALGLPSNATSIRSDITDTFSCESRIYGYYADVDNDCQLFHVCLPVQFADGKEQTFKWSFICPEETVFNQVIHSNTIEEPN